MSAPSAVPLKDVSQFNPEKSAQRYVSNATFETRSAKAALKLGDHQAALTAAENAIEWLSKARLALQGKQP